MNNVQSYRLLRDQKKSKTLEDKRLELVLFVKKQFENIKNKNLTIPITFSKL